MFVDKRILEHKEDRELELYLVPNSKYVSRSIQYAYDILRSRGRHFSQMEESAITELISDKQKSEEIYIHPNHIKAGYMIYLSGAIGVGIFIWKFDQLPNPFYNIFPLIALCVIFAMGYLIKRGTDWLKYVLLMFVVVGTMGMPMVLMNIMNDPILAVANCIQGILQIWAVILMFMIPSQLRNKD